ncbi:MAG: YbaB/EbfC family nucleoid-associated protein [Spirochaetaceae bacterium]|nr:YbaB/EbfC family nucleoid-associated protein [Spirochaetaceae bacterium]
MFPGSDRSASDQLAGGADLNHLLQQAQQMQQQLLAAQEELAKAQVVGSAGGGLVKATVTGGGEVVALEIDPSAIDPTDAEGLADLVLAAIRDASVAASHLQQQMMGPLAEGLDGAGGLGLPGL